jgi:putative ATP-dependent endonuclease of OLD family
MANDWADVANWKALAPNRAEGRMVALRRVHVERFRGFSEFTTRLRAHAVLVGEPGAGRSDLIEAIVRVLDQDYYRSRRADELDFHNLDSSEPATVELVIGALSDAAIDALAMLLELWDRETGQVVAELADPADFDEARHEWVVRIGYQMWIREDGRLDEIVHWPKAAAPGREPRPVRPADRAYLPFLWQRGISARPLDLGGRGDLRDLIDAQAGESFDEAVERFLAEVSDAAARFSAQERIRDALTAVLAPLRDVRRYEPDLPAEDVLRFLPDGGATSGLLRTLGAALTLQQGPALLPATRHGTTALAGLRAGLMIAAAHQLDDPIVVIDDLSADLDPPLARHLAGSLRPTAGQLIVAARSASITDVFEPEEIVRLSWLDGDRVAHLGRRPVDRPDRIAQRYFATQIAPALSASAVVIVEGIHDRLALDAIVLRATTEGGAPSFAGAAIEVIEANGNGEIVKVAAQCAALGIYTIALYDNDAAPGAPVPRHVTEGAGVANVVLYLPPRTGIERILTGDVPDADLVATLDALSAALPDVTLPAGFERLTGRDLGRVAVDALHDRSGSVHAAFVRVLPTLGPVSLALVSRLHTLATGRGEAGIVEL